MPRLEYVYLGEKTAQVFSAPFAKTCIGCYGSARHIVRFGDHGKELILCESCTGAM